MLMFLVSFLIAQPSTPPAFLDGPTRVTYSVESPVSRNHQFKDLQFFVGNRRIAIKSSQPLGTPVRADGAGSDPGRVIVAGSFQSQVGSSDWNPDAAQTQMHRVSDAVYELALKLPKGTWEYKIARGGNWDENYGNGFERGGGNIRITVPREETVVRFRIDFNRKSITDSLNNPDRVVAGAADTGPDPEKLVYRAFTLELAEPVEPTEVRAEMRLAGTQHPSRFVVPRDFLNQQAFIYPRDDLGSIYNPKATTFKVWSPSAREAKLVIDDRRVGMSLGSNGVWHATVPGLQPGQKYRYALKFWDGEHLVPDIYGRAATEDLKKSVVLDESKFSSPGPGPKRQQIDTVLYEMHVRDFTIDPSCGLPEELRGKYLGLIKSGTKTSSGFPTGLGYLKWLGVTDVHLLPLQASNIEGYSWGYATTLFNVPEANYALNPSDPFSPIRDFKATVAGLHKAGLRVVMDVVYNHTWPGFGKDSVFDQIVPYYYLRTNDRGEPLNESGVGNAFADERPMARAFVRQSLCYWLKEYGVDGFRFDLLGMFYSDSVRDWVTAMRKIRPDVTLYGEPWTGGGPTHFPKGAQRSMKIGVFNDDFRSAIRGETNGPGPGFALGANTDREYLWRVLTGSGGPKGFADESMESINYVSAHDDMTWNDKVDRSNVTPKEQAARLGLATVLLSQGVPFIEGGSELGRTKGGSPNTYNGGDALNRYDWSRADNFRERAAVMRELISIRKQHPAFRQYSFAAINRTTKLLPPENGLVAWTIDGKPVKDSWPEILVVLNNHKDPATQTLPQTGWKIAWSSLGLNSHQVALQGNRLSVPGFSAFVLRRG